MKCIALAIITLFTEVVMVLNFLYHSRVKESVKHILHDTVL